MAQYLVMVLVEDVPESLLKFTKEDLEEEARYISELLRPGISPAGAKSIRKAVQKVLEIEPGRHETHYADILLDQFGVLQDELAAK